MRKIRSYIAMLLCIIMAVSFLSPGGNSAIAETLAGQERIATSSVAGTATLNTPSSADEIPDLEITPGFSGTDSKDSLLISETATVSNALTAINDREPTDITEFIQDVKYSVSVDGVYIPIEDGLEITANAGFLLDFNYDLAGSGITIYAGDTLKIDLSQVVSASCMEFLYGQKTITNPAGTEIGEYQIDGTILQFTFYDNFIGEAGNEAIYGSFSFQGSLTFNSIYSDDDFPVDETLVVGSNKYSVTVMPPDYVEGNTARYTKYLSDVQYCYHGEPTEDEELFPYSTLQYAEFIISFYAEDDNITDINGLTFVDTVTNTPENGSSPLEEAKINPDTYWCWFNCSTGEDHIGSVRFEDLGNGRYAFYIEEPVPPGTNISLYYYLEIPEGIYYPTSNGKPGGYYNSFYVFDNKVEAYSFNPYDKITSSSDHTESIDAQGNKKQWIEKLQDYNEADGTIDYQVNFNFGSTNNLDGWHFIDRMSGLQEITSDVIINFYSDSRKQELVNTTVIPYEALPVDENGKKTIIQYELFGCYYGEVSYTAKHTDTNDAGLQNMAALVPPEYIEHGLDYGIKAETSLNSMNLRVDKKVTGYEGGYDNKLYWESTIDGIGAVDTSWPIDMVITEQIPDEEDHYLTSIEAFDGDGNLLIPAVDYDIKEIIPMREYQITTLKEGIPFPVTIKATTFMANPHRLHKYNNNILVDYNGMQYSDSDSFMYLSWGTASKNSYESEGNYVKWRIGAIGNSDLVNTNGITDIMVVDPDPKGLKFAGYQLLKGGNPIDISQTKAEAYYDEQAREFIIKYPSDPGFSNIILTYEITDETQYQFSNVMQVYVKDKWYSDWHLYYKDFTNNQDIAEGLIQKNLTYDRTTAPYAEYEILVNQRKQEFKSGYITIADVMQGDISLVADSVKVLDENRNEVPGSEYSITINSDQEMLVSVQDGKTYWITYKAYVSGMPDGVSQAWLGNTAYFVSSDAIIAGDIINTNSIIYESSATAGTTPYVSLHKTSTSGEVLSGVEFGLYECAETNGVWKYTGNPILSGTTNAKGLLQFLNLQLDKVYCIRETKGLSGYDGTYEKYFVIIDADSDVDFGDSVELVQTGRSFSAVNTPVAKTIRLEKRWEDNNNAAGARPDSVIVNILQDGKFFQTAVITEAAGWKLDVSVPAGHKYSVEETDIPKFYEANVDGYVITNTLKNSMVLPETGGSGVLIYYAVGAMLCMGAVLNFCKKKYHKEKNNIFIKKAKLESCLFKRADGNAALP